MKKFLYHITFKKNIPSIINKGLLVNSNINGFVGKQHISDYYHKYNLQPIFLTNNVNYIIYTQLTKKFIDNCCILKIDISNITIEDEFEYLKTKWNLYYITKDDMIKNVSKYLNKSFICRHNIEYNLISIL